MTSANAFFGVQMVATVPARQLPPTPVPEVATPATWPIGKPAPTPCHRVRIPASGILEEPAVGRLIPVTSRLPRRILIIGRVVMKFATQKRHVAVMYDVSRSQKCNFYPIPITSKYQF